VGLSAGLVLLLPPGHRICEVHALLGVVGRMVGRLGLRTWDPASDRTEALPSAQLAGVRSVVHGSASLAAGTPTKRSLACPLSGIIAYRLAPMGVITGSFGGAQVPGLVEPDLGISRQWAHGRRTTHPGRRCHWNYRRGKPDPGAGSGAGSRRRRGPPPVRRCGRRVNRRTVYTQDCPAAGPTTCGFPPSAP
jgi:hypothetical protein